jgi:hypothetical protein
LGERLNGIQEVIGSIPFGSTKDNHFRDNTLVKLRARLCQNERAGLEGLAEGSRGFACRDQLLRALTKDASLQGGSAREAVSSLQRRRNRREQYRNADDREYALKIVRERR